MAKRIQRKRTKGWKMPEGAVYVGRPTKWGNPFVAHTDPDQRYGRCVAAAIAVDSFRRMVTNGMMWSSIPAHRWPKGSIPARWAMVIDVERELRGKDLACWCRLDQPCHADVLLELANAVSTVVTEGERP
jgi:hypothetical protein